MNRFAELLDRLAYEPGRNNKLRLIVSYFREVEDPDRGYALAALTGALSFKHAKPGLIRDLIAARTDPVLFALSYDYVGDLSETVALMWPAHRETSLPGYPPPQPSSARGEGADTATTLTVPSPLVEEGQAGGYREARAHDGRHLHNNPPPPTLTEVVTTLRTLGKTELPKQLTRWLDELDETGRWALLKLVTGAMRIGISARLAKTAAAALGDKDPHEIELMWPGLTPPYLDLFAWLEGRAEKPVNRDPAPFRPGDAGACDRGCGFCRARCRRFRRGMEMGRHPRAGGQRPRRARPSAGAAVFAQRRGHHQELSRPAAVAAPGGRHRRRTAGAARRPGADLQRAAAAAEPQGRLAKADE